MRALLVVLSLSGTAPLDLLGLESPPDVVGLPVGWRVRVVTGKPPPSFSIEEHQGERALRISGKGAAAWAYRELDVPIPPGQGLLRWSWRVLQLPKGADLRARESDDAALRVYVVFKEPGGLFGGRGRIIFYTWGNAEPEGLTLRSYLSEKIQILRVAGAMEADGRWHEQARDPFADYRRFWAGAAPAIKAVGLMQDTDMTGGVAVAELRALVWERGRVAPD